VADLFKVLVSDAILPAEVFQAKSLSPSACACMLKYVSYHLKIPLVNLYPWLNIAFHFLSVKELFVSAESMMRKLKLPAEVRYF
jgi:hypothetical protein